MSPPLQNCVSFLPLGVQSQPASPAVGGTPLSLPRRQSTSPGCNHCLFCPSTPKDKKYASDKYKDIYTELSIVRAKADCDISKLKEQLKAATEALGEKSPENTPVSGYGELVGIGQALQGLHSKQCDPSLSLDSCFLTENSERGTGRGWQVPRMAGGGPVLIALRENHTIGVCFHISGRLRFSVFLKTQ